MFKQTHTIFSSQTKGHTVYVVCQYCVIPVKPKSKSFLLANVYVTL